VTPFPWKQAIGIGLGVLHLSPQQFWSMTPREMERAMSVIGIGAVGPGRAELDALMMAFPDR